MKNYLVIYDVRGIQKYIFNTKRIKEIVGASNIVKDKLNDLLVEVLEEENIEFQTSWENKEFSFFSKNAEYAEIVYVGGGNLLLAFKGEEDKLVSINKKLQKRFLDATYSLSLAFAYIEMTSDYQKDLRDVKEKLKEVKNRMPKLVRAQASPIVKIDSFNGLPLSKQGKKERLSMESYLKEKAYTSVDENSDIEKIAKSGDRDKTMIAIVHIDGNDIGGMISAYMKNRKVTTYSDGVRYSREISTIIMKAFNEPIKNIEGVKIRTLINSGDDITFIVNAKYALEVSTKIIRDIEKSKLGDINFSSCGGIVYVHSHFPFYRAYELAEQLCSNAKDKAKKEENKVNGRAQSYLDFEILQAGVVSTINRDRENNPNLYLRPYLVSENEQYGDEHIRSLFNKISDLMKKPRSVVKGLRNVYQQGEIETEIYYFRIKSRETENGYFTKEYSPYTQNKKAKFYDASSMIDFISNKEEK